MFTDVPLLNREKSSAHSPPDVARRLATMLRIPSNMLFSGCTYFHNDLFELPIVVSMVTLLPAHTLQPCMHYNVYTTARPRLQVLHLFEAVFHLFISSMVVELCFLRFRMHTWWTIQDVLTFIYVYLRHRQMFLYQTFEVKDYLPINIARINMLNKMRLQYDLATIL